MVQEYKVKTVDKVADLGKKHPIVGVVNMQNLPAPQLQAMRAELRGKVDLFMTKKTFMKIALDKLKQEKKGAEKLADYFEGMPALIFTNESPFRLASILKKSKTTAPAKAGQIAPNDIVVEKGATPFAPGPIISELGSIGLEVGVESGKVAVKKDGVVAKKGDKIKPKVAELLTRLDIQPMEVGLDLVAAYEDGIIYTKDVLEVDEKEYEENVALAAQQALNLSFNSAYPTSENAGLLLGKAFRDARAVGLQQEVFDAGIIDELLTNAERSMLGLKNTAYIEAISGSKEESKEKAGEKEETKQEKPKSEEKPPETEQPKGESKEKTKEMGAGEKKEAPKEGKSEEPSTAQQPQKEEKNDSGKKPGEESKQNAEQSPEESSEKPSGGKEAESSGEKPKEDSQSKDSGQSSSQSKEERKEASVETQSKPSKTETPEVDESESKQRGEVEDLTKELVRKGTLRK